MQKWSFRSSTIWAEHEYEWFGLRVYIKDWFDVVWQENMKHLVTQDEWQDDNYPTTLPEEEEDIATKPSEHSKFRRQNFHKFGFSMQQILENITVYVNGLYYKLK